MGTLSVREMDERFVARRQRWERWLRRAVYGVLVLLPIAGMLLVGPCMLEDADWIGDKSSHICGNIEDSEGWIDAK